MLDGVERFADVDGIRRSPEKRFLFIEARCNSSDSREESSGCRVAGTEPMLRRRRRERRREEGEDQGLKDFRGRAQKGNGAVGGRKEGGFTRFWDGNYKGRFPNGGKVRVLDRG